MENILSQITSLLVEPSGSMVYHLVIAFIFISVLQPAMSFIPVEQGPGRRRRLIIGISLLIVSRLVMFAFSLAAIVQSSMMGASLGVIELVVLAFDLVVIIWLFAFPDDNRTGDIGLTIFALAVLAAGVVSAIYWSLQGEASLGQSRLIFGWQIATILVTVIGLVTLFTSNTPARMQGIILLAIVLVGEVLQLFNPVSGNFLPISRLAHLVAFPLLVGILQNYFPVVEPEPERVEYQSYPAMEFTPEIIEEFKDAKPDAADMVTAPLTMPVPEDLPKLEREPVGSANKALDLHIYQNGLAMAAANTPKQICQLFTRLTAHALVADLCLLLTPPDQNQQVHLVCGYDLIVQETLQSTSFDTTLIPRFEKLFQNARPIHVLDQGTEKMHDFAQVLQVHDVNNLLAYPVMNEEEHVIAAVVLVSPYSKHIWDANDQEYLKAAGPTINAVLQKALAPHQNVRAVENLQQELELSNTDKQRLITEREDLENQIAELTAKLENTVSAQEMDDLIEQKTLLESTLQVLEEENLALETRVIELIDKAKELTDEHAKLLEEKELAEEHAKQLEEKEAESTQKTLSQETQAQIDALSNANDDLARKNIKINRQNEEMAIRMAELTEENRNLMLNLNQIKTSQANETVNAEALEEALAKAEAYESQLAEAQESLDALIQFKTTTSEDLVPEEQSEVIASIAQELRQPLSSISGYTDLLISESVGILGALQKKFLERVKASTERMHQLIDDLVQVATLDSGKYLFTVQPLELIEVIDTAVETTSAQFREKEISLRVDIAPDLPKMHTDKDALQQILLHLMHNAGAATPAKGEIMLKAKRYDKTQDDVILLSVTDTGDGIPKEELPRVFSRLYRADNPLIEGVGDTGVGLSIAKTLTEALGGRIWVESTRGSGSTYSVLLPVTSPALSTQEA